MVDKEMLDQIRKIQSFVAFHYNNETNASTRTILRNIIGNGNLKNLECDIHL